MFFGLTHVDAAPLPAPGEVAGRGVTFVRGGLLLDPPDSTRPGPQSDGHAVFRLFGTPSPDASGFIGSSAEPYRWTAPGELDISRRPPGRGACFRGRLDRDLLRLTAGPDNQFLPPGMVLQFVASPEEPIPADWRGVLYFGPPLVEFVDPAQREDPVLAEALGKQIRQLDEVIRREAERRLERAWRAAP